MISSKGTSRVLNTSKRLLILVALFMVATFVASMAPPVSAFITDVERVSLGTGNVQSDANSYVVSLSNDMRFVTFQSFNTNWGTDQQGVNFSDIFVRDHVADETRRISVGPGGELANQRSFDPIISADGRYVSFNSYASNLVSGDTNHDLWLDDGLDVFVYDWQTRQLRRVSLTWQGEQINGNSVGFINGNGRFVVFSSNGDEIAPGDMNREHRTAIYVRDLTTGAVERITRSADGGFPNGTVYGAEANHDGRYVVYLSEASNLHWQDNDTQRDVMLYDRVTGQTRVVSRPPGGGTANGSSGTVRISPDGRHIVFRSEASNLVPNDTNGHADTFVYDRVTGAIELVSISSTGQQANAESKDPVICADGRYVAFTTEATNLVGIPHNGERQVYARDRLLNYTFLVTASSSGGMSNGRAHRAALAANCSGIGYASEASNIVPNDTNNARDLFVARLVEPANFSASQMRVSGILAPGNAVTYEITLRNGGKAATAVFHNPLPANLTIIPGSLTGGATYDPGSRQIQWSGTVPTTGEVNLSYRATINPSLTDFTLIQNQATITGDGQNRALQVVIPVNGLKTYLPLAARS